MNTVAQRINSQQLAFDGQKQAVVSGQAQTKRFAVPVNTWQQLLPINTGRRFVHIVNLGGNLGYCQVEMTLDHKARNDAFEIDDFNPRFVPTNAIYVYVSDPLATGSTVVNVQVLEG